MFDAFRRLKNFLAGDAPTEEQKDKFMKGVSYARLKTYDEDSPYNATGGYPVKITGVITNEYPSGESYVVKYLVELPVDDSEGQKQIVEYFPEELEIYRDM